MIIIRPVSGGYLVKVRTDVAAVFVTERSAAVDLAARVMTQTPYLLNRHQL